ncbi:hypothetical protein FHX37_0763 [Haloactinospora alba]|uniref:Uncharacterized protein n=1 Tax=Haloactinospora alba TaxID=405555 RepID=A0A543NGA6_9ACTN|nr:hypothetical protein [Haloactinospora alba]TQN30875.1 hypothetical protein FHX37_0763 [Haloactinospora alba]
MILLTVVALAVAAPAASPGAVSGYDLVRCFSPGATRGAGVALVCYSAGSHLRRCGRRPGATTRHPNRK